MGDKAKTVRGTIGGATVETSEENAARLGSVFESEKSTSAKKSAPSPSKTEDKK
jgi:hypothetical protein